MCGKQEPAPIQPDARVTITSSITGVESSPDMDNLYIYPNPAQTLLNIVTKNIDQQVSFKLIDITGRTRLEWKQSRFRTIDIRFLPEGLYVIKMLGADKEFQAKLVKNR